MTLIHSNERNQTALFCQPQLLQTLTEAIIVTVNLILGCVLLRLLLLPLIDPVSGDHTIEEVSEIDKNYGQ